MGKGNFRHPTKSTPLNQSPKKFVTGNYVGDQYSYAKLSARMSTGGFWANGLNITKIILIYAPVLGNSPTGQTRQRIFTHDGSNEAVSRQDVHFWDMLTWLSI